MKTKIDKGKQRETLPEAKKKKISQLKAGYTLVPLCISGPSSGERHRRFQSPVKPSKTASAKRVKDAVKSSPAPVRKKSAAPAIPVIEILDDSSDSDVEISVATTSRRAVKASTSTLSTKTVVTASSKPIASTSKAALVEIDLEEDDSFVELRKPELQQDERDDYSAFEDDIFDEGDEGWNEESDSRPMIQEDPFDGEADFEEAPLAEDDDLGAEGREGRDAESDDDILEVCFGPLPKRKSKSS
jgi:hypothetical protein